MAMESLKHKALPDQSWSKEQTAVSDLGQPKINENS